MHLHACVTDGVFLPAADQADRDAPPTFLPARPITPSDLAALTERVRRRVIRWFRLVGLLDAAAAADMLAWENSGFSIDASVRITLKRPRRAKLFSEPRTLAAVLRSAALRSRTTLRDPRPRRPDHPHPLRAAPTNHKLRRAITALAIGNIGKRCEAAAGGHGGGSHATEGCCDANQKRRSHDTSRIAWAKLMARVGRGFRSSARSVAATPG